MCLKLRGGANLEYFISTKNSKTFLHHNQICEIINRVESDAPEGWAVPVPSVVLLLFKNPVRSHERRKENGTVTTTNGTYPWSSVTQILVN